METLKMEFLNVPKDLTSHIHPMSHTFEDILFGVQVKETGDEVFQKPPKKNATWLETVPSPEHGYFLAVFWLKQQPMFAVCRSHYYYPKILDSKDRFNSHEEGVFCNLCSLKGGDLKSAYYFLPLATQVIPQSLHRLGKSAFLIRNIRVSDSFRIGSTVENVQHPLLGTVYLVSMYCWI